MPRQRDAANEAFDHNQQVRINIMQKQIEVSEKEIEYLKRKINLLEKEEELEGRAMKFVDRVSEENTLLVKGMICLKNAISKICHSHGSDVISGDDFKAVRILLGREKEEDANGTESDEEEATGDEEAKLPEPPSPKRAKTE